MENIGDRIKSSFENKKTIMTFFESLGGDEYINNTDFNVYENVRELGNHYCAFLMENDLGNNKELVAFLLEIRACQLNMLESQKKGSEEQEKKCGGGIKVRVLNDFPEFVIPDDVDKESDNRILTSNYVAELNRGIAYRIKQREMATQSTSADFSKPMH